MFYHSFFFVVILVIEVSIAASILSRDDACTEEEFQIFLRQQQFLTEENTQIQEAIRLSKLQMSIDAARQRDINSKDQTRKAMTLSSLETPGGAIQQVNHGEKSSSGKKLELPSSVCKEKSICSISTSCVNALRFVPFRGPPNNVELVFADQELIKRRNFCCSRRQTVRVAVEVEQPPTHTDIANWPHAKNIAADETPCTGINDEQIFRCSFCENKKNLEDAVSLDEIPTSNGYCIRGQCYDGINLIEMYEGGDSNKLTSWPHLVETANFSAEWKQLKKLTEQVQLQNKNGHPDTFDACQTLTVMHQHSEPEPEPVVENLARISSDAISPQRHLKRTRKSKKTTKNDVTEKLLPEDEHEK